MSVYVWDQCVKSYLFTSINVGECQCICMHGCTYKSASVHMYVCISVCKHDLMQHGIPNTSGALSIFFLARTSCSPERFRRYMTFMSLPWAPAHVAQTTETASAPWQQNAKYCHGQMWVARCQSGGWNCPWERAKQNLNKSLFQLIRRRNTRQGKAILFI